MYNIPYMSVTILSNIQPDYFCNIYTHLHEPEVSNPIFYAQCNMVPHVM